MDGCLLGPPRFTAVPTTPAARAFLIDRRYRSREGGIRASVRGAPLPRPGQKSSYSFLSTENWRRRRPRGARAPRFAPALKSDVVDHLRDTYDYYGFCDACLNQHANGTLRLLEPTMRGRQH